MSSSTTLLPPRHYLNDGYGIKSWLLTRDHKRIALLYLAGVTFFFFVGGAFAGMLLCNLVVAAGTLPFLDRRVALTAGYCSGGRHNALLMAVLPASVDVYIFLFIAAVQLPIYLVPTLLQPVYRRLLPP